MSPFLRLSRLTFDFALWAEASKCRRFFWYARRRTRYIPAAERITGNRNVLDAPRKRRGGISVARLKVCRVGSDGAPSGAWARTHALFDGKAKIDLGPTGSGSLGPSMRAPGPHSRPPGGPANRRGGGVFCPRI
jgi:hypothetical protein